MIEVKYPCLEEILVICRKYGIKSYKDSSREIQFFAPATKESEPMALDPVALSKILSASMPADDKMLFASVEDPDPEPNPEAVKE